MNNKPDLRNAVIAYLRDHSELHTLSARKLAKTVTEPKAHYQAVSRALSAASNELIGLNRSTNVSRRPIYV